MTQAVQYAVVAFWQKSGCKIVADYLDNQDQTCREIALHCIQGMKSLENDRTSLERGKYTLHVLVGELHYACVTIRPECPCAATRVQSYSQIFLDRLRSVYRELPILADLSRDLTNLTVVDLSRPLRKMAEEFNRQGTSADAIPKLEDDLSEIRCALMDGVQKLIDRGQKLDELLRKTQSLQITSRKNFNVAARTTRKKKNVILATGAAVLMFLSTSLFVLLLYVGIL